MVFIQAASLVEKSKGDLVAELKGDSEAVRGRGIEVGESRVIDREVQRKWFKTIKCDESVVSRPVTLLQFVLCASLPVHGVPV